jgi:hypothetical protein
MRSDRVASEMEAPTSGMPRTVTARKPPKATPNEDQVPEPGALPVVAEEGGLEALRAGRAAHMWRRLAEIPKTLPPTTRRRGTTSPMRGPATYQGQGWARNSMAKSLLLLLVSDNHEHMYCNPSRPGQGLEGVKGARCPHPGIPRSCLPGLPAPRSGRYPCTMAPVSPRRPLPPLRFRFHPGGRWRPGRTLRCGAANSPRIRSAGDPAALRARFRTESPMPAWRVGGTAPRGFPGGPAGPLSRGWAHAVPGEATAARGGRALSPSISAEPGLLPDGTLPDPASCPAGSRSSSRPRPAGWGSGPTASRRMPSARARGAASSSIRPPPWPGPERWGRAEAPGRGGDPPASPLWIVGDGATDLELRTAGWPMSSWPSPRTWSRDPVVEAADHVVASMEANSWTSSPTLPPPPQLP